MKTKAFTIWIPRRLVEPVNWKEFPSGSFRGIPRWETGAFVYAALDENLPFAAFGIRGSSGQWGIAVFWDGYKMANIYYPS